MVILKRSDRVNTDFSLLACIFKYMSGITATRWPLIKHRKWTLQCDLNKKQPGAVRKEQQQQNGNLCIIQNGISSMYDTKWYIIFLSYKIFKWKFIPFLLTHGYLC